MVVHYPLSILWKILASKCFFGKSGQHRNVLPGEMESSPRGNPVSTGMQWSELARDDA
jgi:hypothetical protein